MEVATQPEGTVKCEKGSHGKEKHPTVIYIVALCATLGGLLFGYDTGIINGAIVLLGKQYNLSTIYKELIVASTVGAAAVFSLFAGITADRIGRKPTIMMAAIAFVVGGVLMGSAPNMHFVLVGRIIVGCSIGFVSCIVPVYVSECAPHDIRGRLITLNQLFITIGILLSALLAGFLQTFGEAGWRIMLGCSAVPAIIQFVMFIGLPESPRYKVMKGDSAKAEAILKKIRASEGVSQELQDIQKVVEDEKGTKGFKVIKHMFETPHIRKALFIGCMLQFFQQFCGINTVIYYSSSILVEAGFDHDKAIWLACIPFSVNFLATFIGLWAVESLGRKMVLAASFLGIALALVVLCLSFHLAVMNTPEADPAHEWYAKNDACSKYRTCHKCVEDTDCGFCYKEEDMKVVEGACVSVLSSDEDSFSSSGRCHGDPDIKSNSTLPEGMRFKTRCPYDHAWLSVLGLILYVLFFAPGAGPMPWTINAEIYPLWCRGIAVSMATVTNWTCNLIVSFTFLSMIELLTPRGTFLVFAGISVLAAIFVFIMVPETKDKNLEEIEQLFMTPAAKEKAQRALQDRVASTECKELPGDDLKNEDNVPKEVKLDQPGDGTPV